jgi:hypothetical protein
MLGDSFLFRVARALACLPVRTCADGCVRAALSVLGMPGAHRRQISKTHLLPGVGEWRPDAAVMRSRVVGPDGSPCSPSRATNLADPFSVLHAALISGKFGHGVSGRWSGVRDSENGDHTGPRSLQDAHRFGGGGAGGDDVVDHQHLPCQPF